MMSHFYLHDIKQFYFPKCGPSFIILIASEPCRCRHKLHVLYIIVQQIVTMPIYGQEALVICHPYDRYHEVYMLFAIFGSALKTRPTYLKALLSLRGLLRQVKESLPTFSLIPTNREPETDMPR